MPSDSFSRRDHGWWRRDRSSIRAALQAALILVLTGACSFAHLAFAPAPFAGWSSRTIVDTVYLITDRGTAGRTRWNSLQRGDGELYYALVQVSRREFFLKDPVEADWARSGRSLIQRQKLAFLLDSTETIVGGHHWLDSAAFWGHLTAHRAAVKARPRTFEPPDLDSLLLFYVHGYNEDLAGSVGRAAELKWLAGVQTVVAYSWPSRNGRLAYVTDLEQARWTAPHLAKALNILVTRVQPRHTTVVTHSMGGQALSWAVDAAYPAPSSEPGPFRRIALLQPDIDAELFARDVAPSLVPIASRVSVYGSRADKAMWLARWLRSGYPRAGELTARQWCPETIDCLDATAATRTFFGSGHLDYIRHASGISRNLHYALVTSDPEHCRAAVGYSRAEGSVFVLNRQIEHDSRLLPPADCSQFYGVSASLLVDTLRGPFDSVVSRVQRVFTQYGLRTERERVRNRPDYALLSEALPFANGNARLDATLELVKPKAAAGEPRTILTLAVRRWPTGASIADDYHLVLPTNEDPKLREYWVTLREIFATLTAK